MFAPMMASGGGGSVQSGSTAPAAYGQTLEIDTGLSEINGFIMWRFNTSYPQYQSALRYEKTDSTHFYSFTSQAEGQGVYSTFVSSADARKYMVKEVNGGKIKLFMPNTSSYNTGTLYWWAW